MYLEMSGGDMDLAMNLIFGGGAPAATPAPKASDLPDWFGLVWPSDKKEIPDFWLQQDLKFSSEPAESFGIIQRKNGPCGLLAVVQAEIAVEVLKSGGTLSPSYVVSDAVLARALSAIINRCRPSESSACVLAEWDSADAKAFGKRVREVPVASSGLVAAVEARLPAFTGNGGAVLLLYSCVLSRSPAQLRADLRASATEPPLIVGKFFLCSFEMMSLLMRGNAQGNIGAFDPLAPDRRHDWKEDTGVGLISRSFEEQAGMPVCDRLTRPSLPVWIVHGGDHFTTLCAPSRPLLDAAGSAEFTLLHWNGLSPGRRFSQLRVEAPHGPRGPAPARHAATFFKPVPGEIDGVVQADPEDKKARPDQYATWRYEVVLAFDDPSVEGATRPADAPAPAVFAQGTPSAGPWRCTRCYAERFKTFNFSINPAGAESCTVCARPRSDAGWTIWLPFAELPKGWQESVLNRFAPKAITVLNCQWPGCRVAWEGEKPVM